MEIELLTSVSRGGGEERSANLLILSDRDD